MQAATMGHHSWHRVSTVGTQTPALPQNFPVTVEVVSFAPHEQVQQQTTPVLVIEHVTSSVNEFIAPAPPVNFFTPNQQFPACTMAAVTTGVSLDTTGFVHSPCPIADVETSASYVVGSLPPLVSLLRLFTRNRSLPNKSVQQYTVEQMVHMPIPHIQEQMEESVDILAPSSVDESASPVYNHAHQEQTAADPVSVERVQQHTAEQIVHVPIPQIPEKLVEGVKEIPHEHFPAQTLEQIVDAIERVSPDPGVPCATPFSALNAFPHEKFDEACWILDLKQAELREAELVVQRLDRYAALTGQACDVEAASKARQAYESGKVIVENIQRELGAFRALRPPMKTSEASSSTQNSLSAPRKKPRRKR